ncbi:MAG TPA: MYXO-CTERM sorting domain-containing protein [Kofleriaceae bacterium]|nr:MYXO-CTERM sorting domain-containing protein [Kofleriaceae bacterium]
MRRLIVLSFALTSALVASVRTAEANSCNLYYEQRFGMFREGCSVTTFMLQGQMPHLPAVKRNGQELTPTLVQDEITLKVRFDHYPSADSCELLPPVYENRTFDRYVMTWDLQGGDEIVVDNSPIVVPGPGDCGGVPEPAFYCTDPIQSCNDPVDPDPDTDNLGDDTAGCSAGSGSASWLSLLALIGLVSYSRRSRTSSRR